MQNREQPNFKERTLYYASESIVRQGERGTAWDYDIKAVYLVAFTNFSLGELPADFRIDAGLTDLKSGEMFCDKLRLIYLQLPLFTKEADDCKNDFERWIYVLKNMETLNRLPWAAQSSVFQRLAEVGEVSALTKEERIEYDHALKKYRDTLNALAGAEQKGWEKGREEERLLNAKNLKENGVPLNLIAKSLGLTDAELQQL
jgi:predicted transposase/invertase (TIGR01784 family)